jgi:hypothetical protein
MSISTSSKRKQVSGNNHQEAPTTQGERSTTERLRFDHIETLELLNQEQKKNEELSATVKALQKKLVSLGGNGQGGSDSDAEEEAEAVGGTSLSTLVAHNRQQAQELSQLKEQLRSSILDERKKASDLQTKQSMEFAGQMLKLSKRERELTQELERITARHLEEHALLQTHCSSLQVELAKYQRSNFALEEELASTKEALHSSAVDNTCSQCLVWAVKFAQLESVAMDSQSRVHTLEASATKQLATIAELQAAIHQFTVRQSTLDMSLTRVTSARDSLQAELDQERIKSNSCLATMAAMEHRNAQTVLLVSKSENALPSLSVAEAPQQELGQFGDDDAEGGLQASIRFQEFIQLKKENRELKLQLVEISSGNAKRAARIMPDTKKSDSVTALPSQRRVKLPTVPKTLR